MMPDDEAFEKAAAALKEQYQHRIKTVENILAGYDHPEYSGRQSIVSILMVMIPSSLQRSSLLTHLAMYRNNNYGDIQLSLSDVYATWCN